MEDKHRQRILEKFDINLQKKPIEILHIPDDYQYMDAELVKILEAQLSDFFE